VQDRWATVPNGSWVLRGGDLTGSSRRKNLHSVRRAYAAWGICVATEPDKSIDEIAVRGHFGSKLMMQAKSDELTSAGFRVVREPGCDWPSGLILFSAEPSDDDWASLRAVLAARPLRANPAYKGPRV